MEIINFKRKKNELIKKKISKRNMKKQQDEIFSY